jgi:hypothetical protein
LEILLDFCSMEAEGTNLGVLKTRIIVSENAKGAKSVAMDAMDYAYANMPQQCAPKTSPATAFLAVKGALRPTAQTASDSSELDLKTGATGARN